MIENSRRQQRWQKGVHYTKKFIAREGHACVPRRHVEDGFKLGDWVGTQRGTYKSGILAEERRRALEALDGWVWNSPGAAWHKGLDYAERFVEREGHARVPLRHVEDEFGLGAWVGKQRRTYKRGKLPGDRRQALEALAGWTWDPHDASWREGLDYVRKFVEREGQARVPNKHVEDGFRLGAWVNSQRTDYKRDELPAKRREALEALDGWTWDRHDAAWQKGLNYTKRFVEREGHARVPLRHVEDGFKVGVWVSDQRETDKRGKLPDGRRQTLEALDGWAWDAHDAAWRKGLDYTKRFVEREGHARVPAGHMQDGFRLGQWVDVQRRTYKRGKLPDSRRRALEALDGWVWSRRESDPVFLDTELS